jgi:hypothetical protein
MGLLKNKNGGIKLWKRTEQFRNLKIQE